MAAINDRDGGLFFGNRVDTTTWSIVFTRSAEIERCMVWRRDGSQGIINLNNHASVRNGDTLRLQVNLLGVDE